MGRKCNGDWIFLAPECLYFQENLKIGARGDRRTFHTFLRLSYSDQFLKFFGRYESSLFPPPRSTETTDLKVKREGQLLLKSGVA